MSTTTVPSAVEFGFLLNGKWHTDGPRVEIHSPGTGHLVGATHLANAAHAEEAVRGAVQAFEITRHLGGYERQRILRNIAVSLEKQKEEFARLLALEAGKPIRAARVEIERAAFAFGIA